MKAPEKIWLDSRSVFLNKPNKSGLTEYTRTDAFIEKACSGIDKLLSGYIIRNFHFGDSYEIDKLIEDFKNYMRGEEVMKQEEKITINRTLAESICRYCEEHAIYDKLSRYDDFYYKIKRLLE